MSEELHRALRKIVCEYENSREDAAEVAFTMVDIARKALSAQQAAGEAEAVAWLYENGDRTCIWRERAGPGEMCHTPGWTETPLYATPQPTETQRIVSTRDLERKAVVAWLRTASQSARDHHAEVCHRLEDDEILDAIITRMETYAFAADQIERGVHFPSGEHLAGEGE